MIEQTIELQHDWNDNKIINKLLFTLESKIDRVIDEIVREGGEVK